MLLSRPRFSSLVPIEGYYQGKREENLGLDNNLH
jgi:hypothetical protein